MMTTLTYAITHSPAFVRSLGRHAPSVAAELRHELLYGVAAQDAFVALFDDVDDFDAMAREAAQDPLARDVPRRQRTERSRNVGGAARGPARGRDGIDRSTPATPGSRSELLGAR